MAAATNQNHFFWQVYATSPNFQLEWAYSLSSITLGGLSNINTPSPLLHKSPVMLGFLCARRKTWIVSSLSAFTHGSAAAHKTRLLLQTHSRPIHQQIANFSCGFENRRYHSSQLGSDCGAGAASIWHGLLPSSGNSRSRNLCRPAIHYEREGSWNAAWDARPARWLHRPDSAWLLFGVRNCLAPTNWAVDLAPGENNDVYNSKTDCDSKSSASPENIIDSSAADYRVTGHILYIMLTKIGLIKLLTWFQLVVKFSVSSINFCFWNNWQKKVFFGYLDVHQD